MDVVIVVIFRDYFRVILKPIMERAGSVNQDEFFWAIMWAIPQQLVRERLFSGKFAGLNLSWKKQNGGSDILRGKIWQLWTNVASFSLVYLTLQFYGVTYVFRCDIGYWFSTLSNTLSCWEEKLWIRRLNKHSCIKLFSAHLNEMKRLYGSFEPGLKLSGSQHSKLTRLACNRIVEKYIIYTETELTRLTEAAWLTGQAYSM